MEGAGEVGDRPASSGGRVALRCQRVWRAATSPSFRSGRSGPRVNLKSPERSAPGVARFQFWEFLVIGGMVGRPDGVKQTELLVTASGHDMSSKLGDNRRAPLT